MRLALTLAVMAAAWFALDALMDFVVARDGGPTLFGMGFLFLIPLAVGVVLGVTIQRFWPSTRGVKIGLWSSLVFLVLSLLTGPGVVCVIMAAPLWFSGLVLGAWASDWIVQRSPLVGAASTVAICVLACVSWATDGVGRYAVRELRVERSIVIAASSERLWPHLLRLEAISNSEGRWTFSQNVLGVPRPTEAVVVGEGVGAVRTGRWGGGVWFEERIVAWLNERQLDWVFVFPEGSTFAGIDQHIDPRGPNVVIQRGGYRLEPLPNGATRLHLYTTYSLSTAVNEYAEMWGDRIIGDVQSNILEIVKSRAEAGSNGQGVVLAGEIGAQE